MALTREQFDKLRAEGLSVEQIVKFESQRQAAPSTFSQRASENLKKRGEEIKTTVKETAAGKITPVETGVRVVGDIAGAAGDIVGAAISPQIEKLAQKPYIKPAFGALAKGLDYYNKWKNSSETNKRVGETIEAVTNIADLAGSVELATLAKSGVKTAAEEAATAATKIAKTVEEEAPVIAKKLKSTLEAEPITPIKAVGQILQGKPSDIKSGVRSLSVLDVSDVKTFKDLAGKIDTKITQLAKEVDKNLSKDVVKSKLKDLTISAKTEAGKLIKIKPAENALKQLDELYSKTGDVVSSANIKDLIKKAKKEGLTKLEINNLARKYGTEFKSKAFNKIGEPLTSVNSQLYENTRKSLKELARTGITGEKVKIADATISNLYSTKRLVEKNIEAVNKLQQKIAERGLLEKVGYTLTKYGNVLTGGTLRGIVGGLLPRGVGYKTLNALDIEDALKNNLDIIKKAIDSGSDKEILKLLERVSTPSSKAITAPLKPAKTINKVDFKTFLKNKTNLWKT